VTDDSTTAAIAAQVLAAVTEQVEMLAQWLAEQRTAELRTVEGELTRRGHRLLTRLLEVVVGARSRELPRGPARCRQCQAPVAWYGGRSKTLHLLLGDVRLERDYA
jgi:hypothetical protein